MKPDHPIDHLASPVEMLRAEAKAGPPDAARLLEREPTWITDKSVVLDLAYEEFCLRRERGESIDPATFCERFPWHRSSLRRLIDAHRFLEDHPNVLAEHKTLRWPEQGGTFLGFTIVRELGRGAFARVFLAQELALGGRHVAVKIGLHGGQEAEILGKLDHAHIVPVHSVREDPATGMTAVCMPYLGDVTLADVLDRVYAEQGTTLTGTVLATAVSDLHGTAHATMGRLARVPYVEAAVDLLIAIVDALAFLHPRGIYHLDLKPSNVLITPQGTPMLLDFNLSHETERRASRLGGTVPYMSPEQLRGMEHADAVEVVDARSDLFSVGVIAFEALAGQHPFGLLKDASPKEIRRRLLHDQGRGPRSLRSFNGAIPPDLAALVERCLAFDREKRPASAGDVLAELRRYRSFSSRAKRLLGQHRVLVMASTLAALFFLTMLSSYLALRPPYSQRMLAQARIAYDHRDWERAITFANRALDANADAAAYFLRGRIQLQRNQVNAALVDFSEAEKREPMGITEACIAYCHGLLGNHRVNISFGSRAMNSGFCNAKLHNNLGYSYLQINQLAPAATHLDEAVRLDGRLQAARSNRAILVLKKATKSPGESLEQGIEDIEQAMALGPVTGTLCWNAARMHALASKSQPEAGQRVRSFLTQAVELGIAPDLLARDVLIHPWCDETWRANLPTAIPMPPADVRLVDPIDH